MTFLVSSSSSTRGGSPLSRTLLPLNSCIETRCSLQKQQWKERHLLLCL
jgi:hypothetical protein